MDKRCSASAFCTPFAKYSEMASWPSFSTLTPKRFFFSSIGRILAPLSTQIRISMGSRETEVKELAVIPRTRPGPLSTVTTVIPVAKWPSVFRNCGAVSRGVFIFRVFEDTILCGAKAKRRKREQIACMYDQGALKHAQRRNDSWGEGSRS